MQLFFPKPKYNYMHIALYIPTQRDLQMHFDDALSIASINYCHVLKIFLKSSFLFMKILIITSFEYNFLTWQ